MVDVASVRHVAELARLALTDDEAVALSGDLAAILDFVGLIADADPDAGPPGHELAQRALRPDVPVPTDPDALLAVAPALDGRYYAVDRVLPPS